MRGKSGFCLFVVLFSLVTVLASAQYQPPYGDLQRAHWDRDRGDFYRARDQYSYIANDYRYDAETRREAAYFIGFCSVRLNDSWRAIDDFRSFLYTWDKGTQRFVPDALYVLGRTYEVVHDTYRARSCYQDCLRRFPYGEFADKSRDRLRIIDGPYYPPSYPPYPGRNHHGDHGPQFSMEATPARAVEMIVGAPAKSGSDPYIAFSVDTNRVKRIQALIDAVKDMKGVEGAIISLTPEDRKLDIVAKQLKDAVEKARFEKAHSQK